MMMEKLIEALAALPDFFVLQGASEAEIAAAEQTLGLKFAPDYRAYLRAYGLLSANGHELTGLCPFKRLNVVGVTAASRSDFADVPPDWYIIEEIHMDDVVAWQDGQGHVHLRAPTSRAHKVADSLLAYIQA